MMGDPHPWPHAFLDGKCLTYRDEEVPEFLGLNFFVCDDFRAQNVDRRPFSTLLILRTERRRPRALLESGGRPEWLERLVGLCRQK